MSSALAIVFATAFARATVAAFANKANRRNKASNPNDRKYSPCSTGSETAKEISKQVIIEKTDKPHIQGANDDQDHNNDTKKLHSYPPLR